MPVAGGGDSSWKSNESGRSKEDDFNILDRGAYDAVLEKSHKRLWKPRAYERCATNDLIRAVELNPDSCENLTVEKTHVLLNTWFLEEINGLLQKIGEKEVQDYRDLGVYGLDMPYPVSGKSAQETVRRNIADLFGEGKLLSKNPGPTERPATRSRGAMVITEQTLLKDATGYSVKELAILFGARVSAAVFELANKGTDDSKWTDRLMGTRAKLMKKDKTLSMDVWEERYQPSSTFPSSTARYCCVKSCQQSIASIPGSEKAAFNTLYDRMMMYKNFNPEPRERRQLEDLPQASDATVCSKCERAFCFRCLAQSTWPPVHTAPSFGAIQLAHRQMTDPSNTEGPNPLVDSKEDLLTESWLCPICLSIRDDPTMGHTTSVLQQMVKSASITESKTPEMVSESYLGKLARHIPGLFVARTGFLDTTKWSGEKCPLADPRDKKYDALYALRDKMRKPLVDAKNRELAEEAEREKTRAEIASNRAQLLAQTPKVNDRAGGGSEETEAQNSFGPPISASTPQYHSAEAEEMGLSGENSAAWNTVQDMTLGDPLTDVTQEESALTAQEFEAFEVFEDCNTHTNLAKMDPTLSGYCRRPLRDLPVEPARGAVVPHSTPDPESAAIEACEREEARIQQEARQIESERTVTWSERVTRTGDGVNLGKSAGPTPEATVPTLPQSPSGKEQKPRAPTAGNGGRDPTQLIQLPDMAEWLLALWDAEPQVDGRDQRTTEGDPDGDEPDLQFRKGDYIKVIDGPVDDGWYYGQVRGKGPKGWVYKDDFRIPTEEERKNLYKALETEKEEADAPSDSRVMEPPKGSSRHVEKETTPDDSRVTDFIKESNRRMKEDGVKREKETDATYLERLLQRVQSEWAEYNDVYDETWKGKSHLRPKKTLERHNKQIEYYHLTVGGLGQRLDLARAEEEKQRKLVEKTKKRRERDQSPPAVLDIMTMVRDQMAKPQGITITEESSRVNDRSTNVVAGAGDGKNPDKNNLFPAKPQGSGMKVGGGGGSDDSGGDSSDSEGRKRPPNGGGKRPDRKGKREKSPKESHDSDKKVGEGGGSGDPGGDPGGDSSNSAEDKAPKKGRKRSDRANDDPESWDWTLPSDDDEETSIVDRNYMQRMTGKEGKLPKFDGSDPLVFPRWRQEFFQRIHQKKGLHSWDKVDALRYAVTGKAKASVQFLDHTGTLERGREAYVQAIAILSEENSPPMLRLLYLQRFNDLPQVGDGDVDGLREFLRKLRMIREGLRAIGDPESSLDGRVVEIVSKLPSKLRTERNAELTCNASVVATLRKLKSDGADLLPSHRNMSSDTLNQVIQTIQKFVMDAELNRVTSQTGAAGARVSAFQAAASEEQVFSVFQAGSGSPNQQPLPYNRLNNTVGSRKPIQCFLCGEGHIVTTCFNVKIPEKLELVAKKKLCKVCLRPAHKSMCRFGPKLCRPCRDAKVEDHMHHPAICAKGVAWLQSRQATTSVMAVTVGSVESVEEEGLEGQRAKLPVTRQALIEGTVCNAKGRETKAVYCDDSGAQLTLLRKGLADEAGLQPCGHAVIRMTVVGTKTEQRRTLLKYHFPIRKLDLPHPDRWIVAWSLTTACGSLYLQELEPPPGAEESLRKWKGLALTGEMEVDCLVGLDSLDIIFFQPTTVSPGVRRYLTPWGLTYYGRFGEADPQPHSTRRTSIMAATVQGLEQTIGRLPGVLSVQVEERGPARPIELKWIQGWESEFGRDFDEEPTDSDRLLSLFVESMRSLDALGMGEPRLKEPGDDVVWQRFTTMSRFVEHLGKWMVPLPTKDHLLQKGVDNHLGASLASLGRLLGRPMEEKEQFRLIIEELVTSGFCGKADLTVGGYPRRFIPYFLVRKMASSSTPFRLVLNCASRDREGVTYNALFDQGPNLVSRLFDLLVEFRFSEDILTADIKKAFYQMLVDPVYRALNSFIVPEDWSQTEPRPYVIMEFYSVPMGATYAPMALAATLGEQLKRAATLPDRPASLTDEMLREINRTCYVDNLSLRLSEGLSLEEGVKCLQFSLETGGFPLTQFASSLPGLEKILPEEKLVRDDKAAFLGVGWKPSTDMIFIKAPNLPKELPSPFTKRHVVGLSGVIHDPFGIMGPVTTKARLLTHQTVEDMKAKKWNAVVPPTASDEWRKMLNELHRVGEVSLPRRVLTAPKDPFWLVAISDASSKAMGVAIFTCQEGVARFLMARPKLLPTGKGRMTIPRSEYAALTMASELLASIEKVVDVTHPGQRRKSFILTDSQNSYYWSTTEREPVGQWHALRRRKIDLNEHVGGVVWRPRTFTESADMLSTGATVKATKESSFHEGPPLLRSSPFSSPEDWKNLINPTLLKDPSNWESLDPPKREAKIPLISVLQAVVEPDDLPALDPSSFSRMDAFLDEAIRLDGGESPPSRQAREEMWKRWVRQAQRQFKAGEILRLRKLGPKQSLNLGVKDLVVDDEGLLRVGVRVATNGTLPLLLPRQAKGLVKLAATEAHLATSHGNLKLTMNRLRESIWVPRAHLPLRALFGRDGRCKECVGVAGPRLTRPPMPAIKPDRINPTPAFQVSGLDFAGPFFVPVKATEERPNPPDLKLWVLLATCAATRAIHCEVAEGQSVEETWSALERFFHHWGFPRRVLSDNGASFVTLSLALEKIFADVEKETEAKISGFGFRWHRYPPLSPRSGGWIERLIGIFKRSLIACMYGRSMSKAVFLAMVAGVTAAVNTRPLLNPANPDDPPLTPWTALHPEQVVPVNFKEKDLLSYEGRMDTDGGQLFLDLIKQRESILATFRREFITLYVPALRDAQRHKIHVQKGPLTRQRARVGMRYLVEVENQPREDWPVFRVDELLPGKDGHLRFVKATNVRTGHEKIVGVGDLITFELDPLEGFEVGDPVERRVKKKAKSRRRKRNQVSKIGGLMDGEPLSNRQVIEIKKGLRNLAKATREGDRNIESSDEEDGKAAELAGGVRPVKENSQRRLQWKTPDYVSTTSDSDEVEDGE